MAEKKKGALVMLAYGGKSSEGSHGESKRAKAREHMIGGPDDPDTLETPPESGTDVDPTFGPVGHALGIPEHKHAIVHSALKNYIKACAASGDDDDSVDEDDTDGGY